MKLKRKFWAWVVAAVAVFTLVVGGISTALAAAGGTPPHTKNLTDNQDGTYTLSLDVVGEAEKQPNNINVIVILDRSSSMTSTRMNAAKNAINSLANSLFAYNTSSEPNTVEMSLVIFSNTASIQQQPTSNATTFRNSVNGVTVPSGGGTNWEGALQMAASVDFGDDDQTFVIFVSDGNPTFRYTEGNYPNHNNDYNAQYYNQYGVWGTGSDNNTTTVTRCYDHAVDDAESLAQSVGVNNFFTIGAFGSVDRMQSLTTDAGAPVANYYSAQDTAALNQAISDILAKIEMAGIGNTSIEDGTTNQVTTTSGDIAELLEVDTSSFKYYRSGGTYGTMQPWSDAPAATFSNGSVDWDLSSLGVLENGVRYTVTFDCYPSQYTYDTIAQLMNGDITYDSLDTNVKKYIVDNGNGTYSLRTNTNATLSWDDTRDEAGQQTAGYTNPDPVRTDASQLTVNKEWIGATPDVDSLPITVMMDEGTASEAVFHTATLSAANNWSTSSYISVGIIKNGQALPGAEGHDFSFAELDDTQYRWELDAPTVRPMLIDGGGQNHEITMLIKVDADHPVPSGAQTYTIDGNRYYVDSAATGLTATNYRRSNLNLTKAVTGEDAPEDATFPFTLTVNNSKAPATEPTDDPEHNSDYWVWFSIFDPNAGESGATVMDATVSGATGPNASGYYYAPSGTAISVEMKDGWNLRFTNLPSGTTYTFVEGTLADGFAFKSSELTQGTDRTFSGAQTTTGTIADTQTSYYVTYTNDYELTDLEITKVWDDNNDQDGIRPTAEEFAAMLTLDPAVEGKTPTVVVDPEDSNKYTITYTGLPRFNNGTEVEYTVTESPIDGYTTEGSPAEDHGTITNTHVPEVTSVTVTKVWDDDNNIGNIRPDTIQAQLKADGENSGDPVTLSGPDWSYTWENLPKCANGEEIVYTADETAVPSGYDKTGPVKTTDDDGNATFTVTNTYTPTPVTASFPVQKVMDVPEGLTGPEEWSYTIDVAAEDGAPEAASMTDTVDQDTTTVTFGDFTYTKPGTYTYTVSETGEVDGVTNDADAAGKTVTVTVVDNGSGKLVATVEPAAGIAFTNSYTVEPTTVEFPVAKDLVVPEGLEGPATWSYTIDVAANDGAPEAETMTGTVSNSATTATFGPFEYTAPGTYTYKVTETGTIEGVTNDAEATTGKTVTVTVVDNGDGTLTATASSTEATPVTFTNTYGIEPATASFPVQKVMDVPEGLEGPESWSYTIDVAANDGAPVADMMTATVTNTADTATFGPFTYTAPGTYTYIVSETGTVGGVTNDADAAGKTVTVTVTDNGDGTLSATASSTTDSPLQFTNTYAADPTSTTIEGTKTLNGADIADYVFKYQLKEGDEVIQEVENDSEGNFSFDELTYDTTGEHTYTVVEVDDSQPGITYDKTIFEIFVKVFDDTKGSLQTEVTISADGEEADEVAFENDYDAEGTISIPVAKELVIPEGLEGPEDASWTVTLTADEGTPMPETTEGTITADEGFDFGPIAFTEADAGKTYTYTVTETGEVAGVTNDPESAKTVTIAIEDNGDGTLTATVSATEDEPVTFTNTYSVEPTKASFPVEKELVIPEGLEGPTDASWTVTLTADEGTPLPETTAGTITPDEGVTFGDIEFTEPGTYTYTVTESGKVAGVTNDADAATGKTVTITVVDNGDGTLTATASATEDEPVVFTNTYSVEPTTAKFPVKKVLTIPEGLEGPTDASWTVAVAGAEGAPLPETTSATIKADQTVTFGDIEFTEPGTYTYTVTESGEVKGVTNDADAATGKTVTITVVDNGDGTLTATPTATDESPVTFTNVYGIEPTTIVLSASKTLEVKGGDNAPDVSGKFTFTLTGADDGVSETKVNPDGEGTKVDFSTITYSAPGTYTYTIAETGDVAGVTNDANATRTIVVTVTDNGDGTLTAEVTEGDQVAAFTNTYDVSPTTVELKAGKLLEVESGDNAPNVAGAYDITIAASGEAPLPETTSFKNADGNGTMTSFGEIEFTAPGEYQYTISERGSVPGVTNGTTGYTVKVKVTDNGDGTLSAEITEGEAETLFTNTYSVQPATATIQVAKTLTGTPLTDGAFEFTLSGDPLPENAKATNKADGTVTFDEITYTAPGTYTYSVAETDSALPGYTYDSKTVDVTVTVVDNGDGTMTATVAYPNGNEFVNKYEASGDVTLTAKKTLEGRALADQQFSFELLDENGEVIETVKNNESGQVVFTTLTYDQTIFDEAADDATTEDEATADDATTTDDAAATDEATEAEKAAEPETNGFADALGEDEAADAAATEAEATEPAADEVVAEPEATVEETADEANLLTDLADFLGFRRLFAPTVAYADEAARSKTFTYTIREVNDGAAGYTYDGHEVTVTVTVVDNGDGTLTATPEYNGSAEFVNTYKAEGETQFRGTKSVTGIELTEGQFSFELKDANGTIQTVTNDADGNFVFEPISYTEADAGKTFEYTITEVNDGQTGYTYDSHELKVTVNVVDNGDGTLTCEPVYDGATEFVNPYKPLATSIPLTATKTLEGRDLKAGEFTFELRDAQGKLLATVTNAADGTISFGEFLFSEAGAYELTATEVKGSDANVTYDGSEQTFVVEVVDNEGQLEATVTNEAPVAFKNTYTPPVVPPTPPVIPETGDATSIVAMATAALAGIASVTAGLVLRRREN